jgi:SH3-like domain-containing protein
MIVSTLKTRRVLFGVLMAALITVNTLLGSTLISRAQAEPTSVIDAAYVLLSQKLGKSILRGGDSTFNWTQSVYGDASLGCAIQGQTYTAGNFPGYQITIVYLGTTYDFRSLLNGQNLFLCSPGGGAPGGVGGSTGNTGGTTITANPGLFVGGKGRLNGQSATLFQNPVNVGSEGIGDGAPGAIGVVTDGQIVDIVGGPQTFSNTVWWQIRAADGKVGWILQQYPGRPAGTPDVIVPSANVPAQPTVLPPPPVSNVTTLTFNTPLTFVDSNGNIVVRSADQPIVGQLTNDSSAQVTQQWPFYKTTKRYGNIRWSKAGNFLAYQDNNAAIGYVYLEGPAVYQVPTGPTSFPLSWSPNGTQVGFVVHTDQSAGDQKSLQIVKAVQLSGAQLESGQPFQPATQIGTFGLVQDCMGGGGGIDVADMLYANEVGPFGNGLTFEWLDRGFLHSKGCAGTGLVLTGLNGSDVWSVDNVFHVALSPDQNRAAAITRDANGNKTGLAFIDMNNGALTQLLNDANVDRVAWSGDGQTLLYSTVAPGEIVVGTPGLPVGAQMFGDIWPLQAKNYTVALWRVPTTGGVASKVFESVGRGIGNIVSAPNNAGFAFSFITSAAPMIQRINNNASADQALQARPKVQLYYGAWASDVPPQLVAEGGHPRFGSQSQFTTKSGSGGPSNPVAPSGSGPALVVGGQAVVIVQDTTLNVRASPSRSAQVSRLLNPGTIVTIIGGPQQADGLRWWQISANDAQGGTGWVVDQFTDATGTSNTLAPR